MIQEITQSDFIDNFAKMNRENQFTYKGKCALYNYLTDLEEDTGQKIESDIIALCCDFSEYKDLNEYLNDFYTTEEINNKIKIVKEETEYLNKDGWKVNFKERIEEEINDKTTLIKFDEDLDEGFIIAGY